MRARLGGAAARRQERAHAGAQLLLRLPEVTLPHLALPAEEHLVRLGELLALAGRLAALHQLLEGRTPVVIGYRRRVFLGGAGMFSKNNF